MEPAYNRIEIIEERYPDCLKMDGYDDCIIGVCYAFGQEPRIAYDKDKVIEKLMDEGMELEEAQEFHEFNQAGAYMGNRTPVFIEVY